MKNYLSRGLLIALTLSSALLFGACGKKTTTDSNAAGPALDACTLLTGEEIQSIQGSPVTGTKSSGNSNAGLRVSQCFYSAAEFTKSVSVAVTQPDNTSPNRRSAKSYWHDTLVASRAKPKKKKATKKSAKA